MKRPTKADRRVLIERAAVVIKRTAAQNGWTVRYESRAKSGTTYMRLSHPRCNKLFVRIGDHVPDRPTKKTMLVLANVPGSTAIVARYLRAA